jgi:hypothetical protein
MTCLRSRAKRVARALLAGSVVAAWAGPPAAAEGPLRIITFGAHPDDGGSTPPVSLRSGRPATKCVAV